jgi:hypothetical protein
LRRSARAAVEEVEAVAGTVEPGAFVMGVRIVAQGVGKCPRGCYDRPR